MSSGILKKSSTNIQLHVSHGFTNFTQYLNISDHIWFKGVLKTSRLLSDSNDEIPSASSNHAPIIDVTAIGCIRCNEKKLEPVVIVSDDPLHANARLKDLRRGVKYFLNVLFNPVVTFK